MTYSVVPALRAATRRWPREWEPRLTRRTYDPTHRPRRRARPALTCGMAMTEKQGGSDVRANTTAAAPVAAAAGRRVPAHRPQVVLLGADVGRVPDARPGTRRACRCFLVPRWLPDGTPQRHPHPAAEGQARRPFERVERDRAGRHAGPRSSARRAAGVPHDHRDGQPHPPRLRRSARPRSCARASRRRSTTPRTATRSAAALVDKPLMAQRAGRPRHRVRGRHRGRAAAGRGLRPPGRRRARAALRRLATPVVKYWTCKRAPVHAAEAIECLGGAGYVEESGLPRLYRQSPVNGIWEGSGNVICLDVLRAIGRSPESLDASSVELALGGRHRPPARRRRRGARARSSPTPTTSSCGRAGLVERLALVLQGSLLVATLAAGGRRRVLRHPVGPPGRSGLRHAAPPHRRGRDRRPPRPRRLTARSGRGGQALAMVGWGQGTGVGSG